MNNWIVSPTEDREMMWRAARIDIDFWLRTGETAHFTR